MLMITTLNLTETVCVARKGMHGAGCDFPLMYHSYRLVPSKQMYNNDVLYIYLFLFFFCVAKFNLLTEISVKCLRMASISLFNYGRGHFMTKFLTSAAYLVQVLHILPEVT